MRIGKAAVDRLEAPASGYRVVYDESLRGFGVLVTARGVKSWIVRFRVRGTRREGRMVLSRCNVLTAEEAREAARRALVDAAAGRDPRETRAAPRDALTLADLARRWAEDAALRTKTAGARASAALRALPPSLAHRPLAEVTAEDARALHASLRRTPYAANRALETLRGAWNWASERGHAPEANPFARVRRYPERKRERFLSLEELARLFAALADAEEEAERPADRAVVRALRLLALTGCRRGEIARLRWRDVDVERRLLRLPDSKTGARAVPLAPSAAAELARLRAEAGPEAGGWVFPGRAPGRPVAEMKGAWRSICRRADIRGCRIHDLRHTWASLLAGGGASLPIIGAVLGHAQASTTQRYAHLADDPVRRALEAADAALAGALGERASAENFSGKPEKKDLTSRALCPNLSSRSGHVARRNQGYDMDAMMQAAEEMVTRARAAHDAAEADYLAGRRTEGLGAEMTAVQVAKAAVARVAAGWDRVPGVDALTGDLAGLAAPAALTGTEKQVAYAVDLRGRKLAAMEAQRREAIRRAAAAILGGREPDDAYRAGIAKMRAAYESVALVSSATKIIDRCR